MGNKGSSFEREICKRPVHPGRGWKGTVLDRFQKGIKKSSSDECWERSAFWFKGRTMPASRFALFLKHGRTFPGTVHALHHCDNPRCVNPTHIFKGSHQDNMKDKVQKGRQSKGRTHSLAILQHAARGEAIKNSKMTETKIRQIRALRKEGMGVVLIGVLFGLSNGNVSRIVNFKTWSHVR